MLEAYKISSGRRFLDAAFAVERRLMSATRRTGELDYCQGDTLGVGLYSRIFSIMPFAQGIALKLSKELNGYANR
jgi:unsaturated rhamnogalacturonyl hydrolase